MDFQEFNRSIPAFEVLTKGVRISPFVFQKPDRVRIDVCNRCQGFVFQPGSSILINGNDKVGNEPYRF